MSIQDRIRRAIRIQESQREILPESVNTFLANPFGESVATTIYHDFYGSRTGINNRIPVCPVCGYPVNDDFYGNRGTDASLKDGKRCTCDPYNTHNGKN